ncbi:MAG: hypothetical protein HYX72_05990 [Acidobacteria bacterium]|nr:hypothetical protein [Acidobacteriota bacterium]
MQLKEKIENAAQPVVLFELIPPKVGDSEELDQHLALVRELSSSVDAINIPEIREETRQGVRRAKQPERIEPRVFAKAIQDNAAIETIINRVTVHDPSSNQLAWLAETERKFGIKNMILVGGESHTVIYPGPNVPETAALALGANLDLFLGGITIPSRSQEASRIRKKYAQGLRYFTTQVLFDSNDIVDLVQNLNGLDVRIFLSFAPVSTERDVEFLRWLGVDVPKNVAWSISKVADPAKALEKTTAQAAKILTDVFDNLPAHPPGLGINVEQITRRNHQPAKSMLETLGGFYRHLLHTRYGGPVALQQATKN